MTTPFRRVRTARREDVLEILEEIQPYLSGCGLAPRTCFAVELAAEEFLTNVSKYAFPDGEPGEMTLAIEPGEDVVRVELTDTGRPFDPTAAPPPPPLTIDSAIGGRGIHLVRSLAESMSYRREGGRNILVLEFLAR